MTGAIRAPAPQKHKTAAKGKGQRAHITVEWPDLWSIASVDVRPLLLAFSMTAGAGVYFLLPWEPPLWAMLALPSGTLFLVIISRRSLVLDGLQLAIWMLFGVALGAGAASLRSHLVAAPVVAPAEVRQARPVMLEGWLTEIEPGAKGPRLRIQVHAMARHSPAETPKYVRLTHRARLEVSPGRFVRCWAVLRPPPAPSMAGEYDFQRQAWFEQLGGVGYVQGRCRGGTLGAPSGWGQQVGLKVSALRRQLAGHVQQAAGERAGGFAAALISGDRSYMRLEDQEALRNSGLAHLLAISGLHMAIVGGLVYFLTWRALALIEPLALRVAVQKPAAIVALMASLAYLIVSGANVSTQRAFIMSAVVFGAVLFDRAALSMRSFAIAMILVVLMQPESVMTPGFQMSFAASGALIATYEAWTHRRASRERVMGKLSYSWASLAVTSLVAGTATAPFALYHFDRLAGLGLLANLLAMPVITFATAPLAAFALILTPFGYGDFGLRLFGYSLEVILMIAHFCTDYAPAMLSAGKQMPGLTLTLLSLALAVSVMAKGWGRALLPALAVGPAVWVWAAAPAMALHWSPSGGVFLRQTDGQIARLAYLDGDGLSPMRFSTLEPAELCAGWPCILETGAGRIALNDPALTAATCIPETQAEYELRQSVSGTQAGCAQQIYWADVLRLNGITLKTDGTITETHGTCHPRLWRPCPASAEPD
ncbi:MAG: ComEC family competence protein [Alphaproteobacteria bacterium]|nr:ComEC family competence protein [Alphaproteobacteria bacterium]